LKVSVAWTVVLILVLLAGSSVPTLVSARAQPSPGQTQSSFTSTLSTDYYNYTSITVSNVSILAYASKSNVSIDTAVMTGQQLVAFNQTGDVNNSIYSQTGTVNYDALLATPGTYYLVVYSPSAPASINETYIIDSGVTVQNSTTYVGVFLTIPAGETLTAPLHRDTLGSPFQLEVLGASNSTVQYSLIDASQNSQVFASPAVTITNLTVIPTYSAGYNFSLGPGLYALSVSNPNPTAAYVYFEYHLFPAYVNPFLFNNGPPAPTGIGAFGIYNVSGKVEPYFVSTDSIVGFSRISALSAQDQSTQSGQASDHVSLQLNTVLDVLNKDNSTYTYWPQNVLDFATQENQVTYRDNVLNVTGDNAQLANATVKGTGFVSGLNLNGTMQTYYGNYQSNYTYSYTLPASFVMLMNTTVQSGQGVLIQMGVRMFDPGAPAKTVWFDSILLRDPNVAAAAMVVSGDSYTPAGVSLPIGQFYDAELVFGGGAGGQAATFSAFDASLALFYMNQTLTAFPSVYDFGTDTAEGVYNAQVTYSDSNGTVNLTVGTPAYGLLSNNVTTPSLTTLEGGATSATASEVTTTSVGVSSGPSVSSIISSSSPSPSATSATGPAVSTTTRVATTSSSPPTSTSTSTGGPLGSALIGLVAIAVVVLLVIIAIAMLLRRRSGRVAPVGVVPGPSPPPAPAGQTYCSNCGTALEPGTAFCPQCGAAQRPRSPT
jgi:thermopsin